MLLGRVPPEEGDVLVPRSYLLVYGLGWPFEALAMDQGRTPCHRALAPLEGDWVRLSLKQGWELVDSVQIVLQLPVAGLRPLVRLGVSNIEEDQLQRLVSLIASLPQELPQLHEVHQLMRAVDVRVEILELQYRRPAKVIEFLLVLCHHCQLPPLGPLIPSLSLVWPCLHAPERLVIVLFPGL